MSKYCIIGSGISGATIANLLSKNHSVDLFDKARGPGGRSSFKRLDKDKGFDHGTQYISPKSPAFKKFINVLIKKKILKKYNKQLKVVAEALLEYETLTGKEIKLLCQGKKINVSKRLKKTTAIGVDMETATVFSVGHFNEIARGALLLVSDVPLTPEGVKTETSDQQVTQKWVDLHLEIGIKAMTDIGKSGEEIKHFKY